MTLNQIINTAAARYPDALLLEYWDFENECPRKNASAGDTLAEFIVNEISDVVNPKASDDDQIEEVRCALNRAARELHIVIEALVSIGFKRGG